MFTLKVLDLIKSQKNKESQAVEYKSNLTECEFIALGFYVLFKYHRINRQSLISNIGNSRKKSSYRNVMNYKTPALKGAIFSQTDTEQVMIKLLELLPSNACLKFSELMDFTQLLYLNNQNQQMSYKKTLHFLNKMFTKSNHLN